MNALDWPLDGPRPERRLIEDVLTGVPPGPGRWLVEPSGDGSFLVFWQTGLLTVVDKNRHRRLRRAARALRRHWDANLTGAAYTDDRPVSVLVGPRLVR